MAGRSAAFFAPLRVFLIESDVEQRDRIERDLRSAGFLDIVALPNFATAQYLLDMLGCDVVIAEFGVDCLRLLEIERHADTFVIAMEPARTALDIRLEPPAGVDVLLSKPVSGSDLLEAVAACRASRPSQKAPQPRGEPPGRDSASA